MFMERSFEAVDKLRKRIQELEKKLAPYGFDERRGIETYKVSEIKKTLKMLPQKDAEDAKNLLRDLVKIQQTLYHELYKAAEVAEIATDTHMPEKKLEEIKEWLDGPKKGRNKASDRFAKAVREVIRAMKRGESTEFLAMTLTKLYKRDYDRFRILDFVASIFKEMGIEVKNPLPQSLYDACKVLLAASSMLDMNRVMELAKKRLES